jgi:hypothetical protein
VCCSYLCFDLVRRGPELLRKEGEVARLNFQGSSSQVARAAHDLISFTNIDICEVYIVSCERLLYESSEHLACTTSDNL